MTFIGNHLICIFLRGTGSQINKQKIYGNGLPVTGDRQWILLPSHALFVLIGLHDRRRLFKHHRKHLTFLWLSLVSVCMFTLDFITLFYALNIMLA